MADDTVNTVTDATILTVEPVAPTEPTDPTKEPVAPVEPVVLQGAPDKYEDFNFPDGMDVDKAHVEAFIPMAKELDLTQAQAQKLVDMSIQNTTNSAQAQANDWNNITTEWLDNTKADEEIGKTNFDESVNNAKLFLKQFGTPELSAALSETGVGNHPEFVRVFARAGKLLREDKIHIGGAGKEPPRTQADILFGNQHN